MIINNSKNTATQDLHQLAEHGLNLTPLSDSSLNHILSQPADARVAAYGRWAKAELTQRETTDHRSWHVAQTPDANDDNSGQADGPLSTIQRAADMAQAGDTIIIHEGTYRECIRPAISGKPGAPITYCAADGDTVNVVAMDPWDVEWVTEDSNLFSTHYTPHAWENTTPGLGLNMRTEQLFLDGTLLTHCDTLENLKTSPLSFFIDYETARLWLHLDQGTPQDRSIERSNRQQCFVPWVVGLGYIHVNGIHFKGGASQPWTGANWHDINQLAIVSVEGGHHWVIEDCSMTWGNAQGLQVAIGGFAEPMKAIPNVNALLHQTNTVANGEKIHHKKGLPNHNIIRRNLVAHNGIAGIVGIGGTNHMVVTGNTVRNNAIKPNKGTCEEAGIKIHSSFQCYFANNQIHDNIAHGLWLDCNCEHSRIHNNRFANNDGNHVMHELSPGPLLVDNNLFVDERQQTRSCGFYTHDGNHATITNNVFVGLHMGIRVRALFHRHHQGELTRTCDNLIVNNIFSGQTGMSISLMPNVARAENNHSDHNMFWNHGKDPILRCENSSDVGAPNENLRLGKALGLTGCGEIFPTASQWIAHSGHDEDSLQVPLAWLFKSSQTPDADTLHKAVTHAWAAMHGDTTTLSPSLNPWNTQAWVAQLVPGKDILSTTPLWLSPDRGYAHIDTPSGSSALVWDKDRCDAVVPVAGPISIGDTYSVAAGESLTVTITDDETVSQSSLDTEKKQESLSVITTPTQTTGQYHVLLNSGRAIAINVNPALTILDSQYQFIDGEGWLITTIRNQSQRPIDGELSVRIGEQAHAIKATLNATSETNLKMAIPAGDAALVHTAFITAENRVTHQSWISFAVAKRQTDWTDVPTYNMEHAENAVFPEGADWSIFYKGDLKANWQARWDDEAVAFRVIVNNPHPRATRRDMEGIHCGDGVKIMIKGTPGMRAAVVGMNRIADTGEATMGFCKSAVPEKYPVTPCETMGGDVTRHENTTTYEAILTWDMLGLDGTPSVGSPLPLSLVVFNQDPTSRYGLKWFDGILYDADEGKESVMGQVLLVD